MRLTSRGNISYPFLDEVETPNNLHGLFSCQHWERGMVTKSLMCEAFWTSTVHVSKGFQRNYIYIYTPPKINIEPENDGLEDDFPFPGVYSQVPC